MAQKPFRRFYLADLVLATLLCGLVVALFSPHRVPANPVLVSIMFGVVVAIWTLFRQWRQAPTCGECGRMFIPARKPVMPGPCLHCGREQLALIRSIRRLQKVFWSLVGVLVILLAGMAVLVIGQTGGRATIDGTADMLKLMGCWGLILLALFGVGIYRSYLMRPREHACEACGSIIDANLPAGSMICPHCQSRHLRPEVARKQQAKAFGVLFIFLGIMSLLGTLLLVSSGGSSSGMTLWLYVPLLVLAVFIAIFVGIIVIVLLTWVFRRRQLRSERGALAMARKCAGQEGEVVKEGAWSIWYSGPDDPTLMLREQMAAARRLFETLLGGTSVAELPLRSFVFHDRGAFLRFHMRIFPGLDCTSYDGIYVGHPSQLFTLCTAPAPGRLTNPQRTTRSVATYALLESVWGPGPPAWLQSGLSRVVAHCDDPDSLSRLNRKMAASLARDTALSTEIFTLSLNDLSRLLRGSKEPANFQRRQQFHSQSWSIVEYLCGEQAPDDMRMSLGAFLRDSRSKTNQEESFRLQFRLGFGPLFDGWRQWVLDQEIRAYKPPSAPIRDGLLERVLPVIRDRQARHGDRIAAIREWADLGFVLGAETLVDLLREPGDIPKEEIVWALCMVSGLGWGNDLDRWQAWCHNLSSAGDEPLKCASIASDQVVVRPNSAAPVSPSAAGVADD